MYKIGYRSTTSSGDTKYGRVRVCRGEQRGEQLRVKEVAISKNAREGGVKGRRSDDFQEEEFGELNAVIDTTIRIPELRAES